MSNTPIDLKAVVVHNFVTREYGTEHHRLIDEMTYGRALQNGDDSAIEAMVGAISSPDNGTLSKDPLTNIKYFYITGVTCTVRSTRPMVLTLATPSSRSSRGRTVPSTREESS